MLLSAHSEFQYTHRCNAPLPQLLLNMESACAYIALPGIEEAYKNPDDFMQKYLHSDEFRNVQRNKVASSPKTIYGDIAIELGKILDLLENGSTKEALSKWNEARMYLPKCLRVERDDYGLE